MRELVARFFPAPIPRPRLEPVVYNSSPWFAARRPSALPPVSADAAQLELWQPDPAAAGFPWFGS